MVPRCGFAVGLRKIGRDQGSAGAGLTGKPLIMDRTRQRPSGGIIATRKRALGTHRLPAGTGELPERALRSAWACSREAPDAEHPLQPPVGRRIVRLLHRLVVLAEELDALVLRQLPEYHQRVLPVLCGDWLSGHSSQFRYEKPQISATPRRRVAGRHAWWVGAAGGSYLRAR